MGNDNKINKEIEKVSSRFLPEEIHDVDTPKVEYSIEEEFAKTGKNKSIGLILLVTLFVVGAVFLTIVGSIWLSNANKSEDIKVKEFHDLRMKDILDKARQDKGSLDKYRQELGDLQIEMDNKIVAIKEKYRIAREKAIAANLSDKETNKKIRTYDRKEKKEIGRTKARYRRDIAAKKKTIAVLEKKINSSGDVPSGSTSNFDKLYKLKIDNLKASYTSQIRRMRRNHTREISNLTLKYNPRYRSYELKKIIKNQTDVADPTLFRWNPILRRELSYSYRRFTQLRKNIKDRDLLLKRMMKIPYKNSIPPSLRKIENLTDSIVKDYEIIWYGLGSRLSSYNFALDYIIRTRPESGLVLDPRNPKRIIVHLNRALNVPTGTKAFVFRNVDDYIGTIELVREFNSYSAKVIKLSAGKSIEPLDKILLRYTRK